MVASKHFFVVAAGGGVVALNSQHFGHFSHRSRVHVCGVLVLLPHTEIPLLDNKSRVVADPAGVHLSAPCTAAGRSVVCLGGEK